MIWYLFFGILAGGFVLAVDFFFAPLPDDPPPSRLPDVSGVFTPEQVEGIFRARAQYEAGLLTDDDIDYFQRTWP